jgi:hypothetical protein
MRGFPDGMPWLSDRRQPQIIQSKDNSRKDTLLDGNELRDTMPLFFHSKQPTFRLSTGATMPALSFGTAFRSANQLEAAIEAGFRHLDLAEMYGNENELGVLFRYLGWDRANSKAVAGRGPARTDVFITSKVGLSIQMAELNKKSDKTRLSWTTHCILTWICLAFSYFLV